jgi:hypothetical protein
LNADTVARKNPEDDTLHYTPACLSKILPTPRCEAQRILPADALLAVDAELDAAVLLAFMLSSTLLFLVKTLIYRNIRHLHPCNTS